MFELNLKVGFNKEKFQVADKAVFYKKRIHPTDIQKTILKGAWHGYTYEKLADIEGYSDKYLKRDVGPRLWKILSEALGEKVSKKKFRTALQRRLEETTSTLREKTRELALKEGEKLPVRSLQLTGLKEAKVQPSQVWTVAFSPEGNTLASGSDDGTVKLWDVRTGNCLRTLQGHTGCIWTVAFSPEGNTLASGSDDRTVKLWDVRTGNCLRTLRGHTGWISTVAFSPQGNTLASSSQDETTKLWDLKTGKCLKTLRIDKPYKGMNNDWRLRFN